MIATGGTLFGNPLSMAAARATMAEVLTPDAYAHTQTLGARLADGIEAAVSGAGLPWTTHRFWPRSGYTFAPSMPRNAERGVRVARRAAATPDPRLPREPRRLGGDRRRGTDLLRYRRPSSDVDAYVEAFGSLVGELTS